MKVANCRHCTHAVMLQEHKALNGEFETLLTDLDGEWICPETGDEHEV